MQQHFNQGQFQGMDQQQQLNIEKCSQESCRYFSKKSPQIISKNFKFVLFVNCAGSIISK